MGSLDCREYNFCDDSDRIVALDGDLDAYSAPRVRALLLHLADSGSEWIVVDCSALHYVDSSGLGTLVAVLKQMSNNDGTLALASPNESVMRVLQITGLDRLFRIFATVDEAREARRLQPV